MIGGGDGGGVALAVDEVKGAHGVGEQGEEAAGVLGARSAGLHAAVGRFGVALEAAQIALWEMD